MSLRDFVGSPASNDFRIQPFPKFAEVLRMYGLAGGAAQFDEKMEDFRQQLERMINEKLKPAEAAATTTVTATADASIAALRQELSGLINAATAGLDAHILATVTHGTSSDIVGVSDAQSLNRKQIGTTHPGYGRFTHVVQSNTVPSTETLVIEDGENMVVGGAFTVAGTLTINGTVVFV